jgi:tyrosinase
MAEQVITSGVVGGPLVSRVEIRTFAKDQDVMNLYLLALERFQNVDQKSPHSWFQIAGIHGRLVPDLYFSVINIV